MSIRCCLWLLSRREGSCRINPTMSPILSSSSSSSPLHHFSTSRSGAALPLIPCLLAWLGLIVFVVTPVEQRCIPKIRTGRFIATLTQYRYHHVQSDSLASTGNASYVCPGAGGHIAERAHQVMGIFFRCKSTHYNNDNNSINAHHRRTTSPPGREGSPSPES